MLRESALSALSLVFLTSAAQFPETSPFGFYTDKPSYVPGETIEIFGNWNPHDSETVQVKYRLMRFGRGSPVQVGAETPVFEYGGDQVTPFGSFVEYPNGVSLENKIGFTIEGWIFPTLPADAADLYENCVALAGQLEFSAMATPLPIDGVAGIGVTDDGRPFAFVRTVAGPEYAVSSVTLLVDRWYYVAATYNGSQLKLHVGEEAGWIESVSEPAGGAVIGGSPIKFRLGARAEAPGDLTGCFDGRLDTWSVWAGALAKATLNLRRTATDESLPSPGGGGGGPMVLPLVLMTANFEDPYGTVVDNGVAVGLNGTIVGHGTPGMAGRLPGGIALRLNHDQVADAQWTSTAELASGGSAVAALQIPGDPSPAASGLYAVQALVDDGSGFDPNNTTAERWQCLVVRPAPGATAAPVAIVVPINTWIAYNGWPLDPFASGSSAFGMSQLGDFRQGNNSAYNFMGDGRTLAHFIGWRRPNVSASPYFASGSSFSVRGPMVRLFFEWLSGLGDPLDEDPPTIPYDVYSDWDLDDGTLGVAAGYSTLVTVAHHEYWSQSMLEAVNVFMAEEGGSLINVGGNLFAYGAELARTTGVVEIKKWPTNIDFHGEKDKESLITGGPTGFWRYVMQCMTPAEGTLDQVLGTRNDIVVPCSPPPGCFGNWKVVSPGHFLWCDATVAVNDRVGLDSVGHEADTHDAQWMLPASVGSIQRLAVGTDFSATGVARALKWDHESFDPLNCADLDAEATNNPNSSPYWTARLMDVTPTSLHGHILYYLHNGGGHVLSVASTAAPLGVRNDPDLSAMVYRAFRCFALGDCCP